MKQPAGPTHSIPRLARAFALPLLMVLLLIPALASCSITRSIPTPAMTETEETQATTPRPTVLPTSELTTTKPPATTTTSSPPATSLPPTTSLPPLEISKKTRRTTPTTRPETQTKTTARPVSLSAPGSIAITFDDGPGGHTARLLDELRKYDVKVTFFVLGQLANSRPDLILRMRDEGHEIANHTYSHKYLSKVSEQVRQEELATTSDILERITGTRPTLMRTPGGYRSAAVFQTVKEQGMAAVFWDIDPADWKYRNADYVCQFLLNRAQAGKIILLHDIHKTTVDGFIRALPILVERGFNFVTVSELVDLEPGDVYPAYWGR